VALALSVYEVECPHNAPSARISATETFVRGFIARSQTRNIGRIPIVQSAHAEMAEWAYVESVMTLAGTHFPAAPTYCVQKYVMGEHWKTTRKK
jgi:hypothetical protein